MLEQLESIVGQKFWDAIKDALHEEMADAVASKQYDRLTELLEIVKSIESQETDKQEVAKPARIPLSTIFRPERLAVLEAESDGTLFAYTKDCLTHYGEDFDEIYGKVGDRLFSSVAGEFNREAIATIIKNSTDFPGVHLAIKNGVCIGRKEQKALLQALSDMIVSALSRKGKVRGLGNGFYEFIEQNPQNLLRLA